MVMVMVRRVKMEDGGRMIYMDGEVQTCRSGGVAGMGRDRRGDKEVGLGTGGCR